MNPKQIVSQGYDIIAERYATWSREIRVDERQHYETWLLENLPEGAALLELGCGASKTTQRLAARFRLTGVDISARQIELARQNVPDTTFIQADMTQLHFPPESFDGIAAFYTIFHVPRHEHADLLHNIARMLRPGGILVATLGHGVMDGIEADWLGVPMHFSHWDADTNRQLVTQTGLKILSARSEIDQGGDPVTFLWVIAQKPKPEDVE